MPKMARGEAEEPRNRGFDRHRWSATGVVLAAAIAICALSISGGRNAAAQNDSRPTPTPDGNFSQFPGFEAYLLGNPPSDRLPDAAERALLQRFRPRLFLPAGQDAPIDFYADYIAHGTLRDGDGTTISDRVDQSLLNQVKLRPLVVFTHDPGDAPTTPTFYGRIDRTTQPVPMTFLTYHAVFRQSGLPAGLPSWQAGLLSIVADPDDWHQLDHYTAVSIVLDRAGQPFAVMLQQHNYLRTYLIGEGIDWPEDDRIAIDVAIRSNELYPHSRERRSHRAVRFLTPEALEYLTGFGPPPFPSADDITEPTLEVDARLAFLAPNDAFYVFRGFLGERRAMPGRDGPPGAFYNTIPPLKPLHLQLGIGYWRIGSQADRARALQAQQTGDNWRVTLAEAQLRVLLANSACVRQIQLACAGD